ncbi:MAG: PD-(D/E)XK nuclease family protein [Planctomycetes bacterium]|nr:PD-(D/E)XK nuclease family protein [Planctomycetota bacterium]
MRILAAPGPAREVEEIGREVRALLAAGTGPDAIGIVFRSLAVYGPLVEDAFRRMGIPTQFRRGSPVLAVPAVRALLALLEMAASPGSLEPDRVVSLCSSAYLDLEFPSPTGPVPAPALEATLAQAGVLPGTPAEWDRALARHVARLGRGRGARSARRRAQRLYADAVRRGVADLAAQLSALGSPRTPAGHAGAIRDAMRRFGFRRRVRSAAELPLRRRDGLALVAVDRILSEAEDAEACGAAPKRDLPLAGFLDLLARGLAEVSVPGEPAAGGGVRVLDAFDARGLRFDAVFVGGLVEGEFPVAHREPHLFTDEERELFRDERGRRLFRSTRLLQWEDPLLFCLALSSARREAILSYPTVDARGEAVLRSYFVEEVLRLLAAGDAPPGTVETERVREVPLSEIVPPLERATDRASVLASLFREMWRRPAAQADGPLAAALFASLRRRSAPAGTGAGAGDPDTCLRLARIETRRERFFGAAEPREREGLATPWTGLLDEGRLRAPLARRLLTGRKAVWSASHFEEYANCPFSFFMDRVLDLEAFVRPEVELSPAAVGTLAHAILETCFRDLHARGALPIVDRDAAQTALSRAAEQVFEHWEREENLGDPVFWELRKREVLAVLRGVVEREAELEAEDPSALPAHFEFPFGFGSGEIPDPVGVPMGEMGTVRLRGKIDRVDLGPDRLRVVDYKYSRSKEKFTDATSEARVGTRNFQLPLYLWVLGKHLEARGVLGASAQRQGGIFLLKEPDLLTATFPAALFGEPSGHGDDLPTRIGALLKRALDGRFDVTPHECPFWCEFRNACRYYLPLRGS